MSFPLSLYGSALFPQQTSTHTSDIYRDEFKLQPESARLSEDFSNNAWIVLLYASHLSSTQQGDVAKDSRTDVVMEKLRGEVKTDGEWLFWFRLKNYSTARQAADDNQAQAGSARHGGYGCVSVSVGSTPTGLM